MSKRRETPDLMGGLLAGDDRSTGQQISTSTSTYQRSSPGEYVEPATEKIRATHYFLPDTLDLLEDTTPKLKKLVGKVLGRKNRAYISKSLLVERAVRLMLEDYEQNGADSLIAKDLMRLK